MGLSGRHQALLNIVGVGYLISIHTYNVSADILKCEERTYDEADDKVAEVNIGGGKKIVVFKSENVTFCDSVNKCSKSGYRLPMLHTSELQEKLRNLLSTDTHDTDTRVWLPAGKIDGWWFIDDSLRKCGSSCNRDLTTGNFGASVLADSGWIQNSFTLVNKKPFICMDRENKYQVYQNDDTERWYQAQNTCLLLSSKLVPMTEIPRNISGVTRFTSYWNGLLYKPWVWVPERDTSDMSDVIPLSYTSWGNERELDDSTDDDCIYANTTDNALWGVARCNTTYQFYICEEVPLTTTQSTAPDKQTSIGPNQTETTEETPDNNNSTLGTGSPTPAKSVGGGVKLVYWLPVVLVLIVAVIFAVGIGLYCKKKKEKEKNGWKPQVAAVTAPATGHVNPMDVVRDEKEPEAISPYGVFDVATNSKVAPSDAADDYKPRAQSTQYAQVGANLPKPQSQNVPPSHYALAGAVPRDSVTYSEVKKAEDNDTVLVDNPQYGDLGAPQGDDTGAEPWQQNRVPPIGSADNSGNRQNDGTNDKPKPKIGKKPKNTKQETDMV